MNRHYTISLTGAGIDALIRGIEEYKTWLNERAKVLVQRLADEGYQVASLGFQQAAYDGTNDSSVSVEDRGDYVKAVIATGSAVLFIEFGTGVTYPDNHPEAAKHGMIRGEYGKGKGKQSVWGYYGEPGTNGTVIRKKSGKEIVLTRGNPANMPMYEAVKQLKERLPALVSEVFGSG